MYDNAKLYFVAIQILSNLKKQNQNLNLSFHHIDKVCESCEGFQEDTKLSKTQKSNHTTACPETAKEKGSVCRLSLVSSKRDLEFVFTSKMYFVKAVWSNLFQSPRF